MAVGFSESLGLEGMFGSLGSLGLILVILISILIFLVVMSGIAILIIWWFSYNQKIFLWATIDGKEQKIAKYKGKWIRLPKTTKRMLYIRSADRYECPIYMTGKNEWHFHRRSEDANWHNLTFENVDTRLNEMKIHMVQGDVRMQSEANEKILRDRLQKKKDIMGIITMIAYIIVFIIIFVALVVLFSQLTKLSKSLDTTSQSISKMADSVNNFYGDRVGGQSPRDIDRGDTGILQPVET